jgi:ribosomal subunit interface protein
MKQPLQITYRGMTQSEALSSHIREHLEKLEHFFDGIQGCRVVVDEPHRHKSQGKHFHVLVDLTVPGREIVVGRDPVEHRNFEDPYIAVSEAFEAARRQLERYVDGIQRHHR